MKILKIVNVDLTDGTALIDLMGDGAGDKCASQVCVQIDNTVDLTVKGSIVEGGALEPVALIKLEDMTVANHITGVGIYLGDVSALTGIALVGTGKATVKVCVD